MTSPNTISVLHVDDDPDFLALTADYLEQEDARIDVRTATSAASGLDALADADVDCIVSDYEMPSQDGIEFLRSVRNDFPEIPFILFTGKGSEDIAARAIGAGVTSYLQKEPGTAQYTVLRNRIEAHVDQYKTKREIDRVQREYKLIADAATDAFWILDPETDRLRLDGLHNFGYDEAEGTRTWWSERIHPDDRERVFEHDAAVMADDPEVFDERDPGRGWFSTEYRWRRADGTYADCIERGVVVFQDGDPVKMIGTISDATERKQRKRELEAFAGVVSHDLRNPLRVAKGRLELPQETCGSEHLASVERAHDRMETLIENLLTLARGDGAIADMEAVDPAAVMDSCWSNVETVDASLVVNIDRMIEADSARLKRLLENLLRNAIEHGGEDVTVTVGELSDGFYVEDDGSGIPAANYEDVFETGYSTGGQGVGFGLSIVKRMIEIHDWNIRVTDGTDGGARFEITGVDFAAESR